MPKGSRTNRVRAGSTGKKKQQFRGNQFSDETGTDHASKSAEKLKNSKDATLDVHEDPMSGYVFISFAAVFCMLQEYLKCKVCNGAVKFTKYAQHGLGFQLCVACEKCGEKYINSCPKIGNGYEVNRRLVFIFRLLGIGLTGINKFCNLMELGIGLRSKAYYNILDKILTAVDAVFTLVTRKAVAEEQKIQKEKGLPEDVLSVSGDGSWAKRGFTSLIGIISLILKFTGKVVDVIIKSSYCKGCQLWKGKEHTLEYAAWYEKHEPECSANHEGSSGKMEMRGIVEMFFRSIERFAVRYGYYIGDGDTKTFKWLLESEPYGEDFEVKKLECVLHVAKRVFKRANEARKALIQKRKAVKQAETTKDSEDTPKKRTPKKVAAKKTPSKPSAQKKVPAVKTQTLTVKLMKELSTNYGLAVRRNVNSVEGMRKEIWAGFYHKISTDAKPQHSYCSIEWCKYLKAKAAKEQYTHPPALADEVQEVLKPIYEDLTKTELLERCLGGNTQNNNESFNTTVWTMAPKHIFHGKQVVEIACKTAACIFNEGNKSLLKILDVMNVRIGPIAKSYANKSDKTRISTANRRSSQSSKESRSARKKARLAENEEFEQEEGEMYGAGIAD